MHREDLPCCIGFCRIVLYPFQSLCKLSFGGGVVDDSNIDTAIGYGIAAAHAGCGKIVYCRGNGPCSITGELVIAQNLDHIGIAEILASKQCDNVEPVIVIPCIVHCVACLNTKVIVFFSQRIHQVGDLAQILCLDIAENEEVCSVSCGIRRKRLNLCPIIT